MSPWGKRRLAYEIQHFREASYFLLHFDIAPSQIREIERGMLISEEILRHLVTVLEDRGELSEDDLPAAVPAAMREDEDGDGAAFVGEAGEDEESPRDAFAAAPAGESDDVEAETDATDDAEPPADEPLDAEPVEA